MVVQVPVPVAPIAVMTAGAVQLVVVILRSALTTDELVTACVEPAKWAMPAPGEDDVTQEAQAIVPVLVIVPPVIGEVVAMLVTVPLVALSK